MQALLLIAHGSRKETSNDEVRALTKILASRPDNQFNVTVCAFLELANPSIPEGISKCVKQGAREITVLPYFLSAGRHVVTDIPTELEKAKKFHPNVDIKIAPYLGSAQEIGDVLIALSNQAQ